MNPFSPANHLLLVILTPLVGALAAWLLGSRGVSAVRQSAAVTTLITLAGAVLLVLRAIPDVSAGRPFAVSEGQWLVDGPFDIRLSLGLDGLSIWLFGLSALLSVTAVMVSWEAIKEKPVGFYGLLLVLESAMLGVFAARDVILFYVFFEFTLVPLFFLIGIWGHDDRRRAAVKFFIYTLAGSVLAFLGLVTIVLWNAAHSDGTLSFDIATLTAGLAAHPLPMDARGGWLQWWVFLALFAGFAVKVPIVPFHTWLPLAHVEAPTGGSVDLAGVLLKIGIYGFLRFSLPMLPDATAAAAPWILGLGVIGILYGALVALAQTDLKRLIAYSSVSHMGYCVMGVAALEPVAVEGATLQLINHGLSAAGLFALVGMIYERYHTRSIANLGGIAARAPWLAFMFLLFTFSSIGLPGLNGFVGEFMVLLGSFQRAWGGVTAEWRTVYLTMSVASVVGVVLGAWYMLWAVERVFFGASRQPPGTHGHSEAEDGHSVAAAADHGAHGHDGHGHGHAVAEPTDDLRWYEWAALAPLALFVVWIGLFPAMFLGPSAVAVRSAMAPAADSFAERMRAADGDTHPAQTALESPATILSGVVIVPAVPSHTAGPERNP